jgi:hypothetical protein
VDSVAGYRASLGSAATGEARSLAFEAVLALRQIEIGLVSFLNLIFALQRLCPDGCEEYEDLQKAIDAKRRNEHGSGRATVRFSFPVYSAVYTRADSYPAHEPACCWTPVARPPYSALRA